MNSCPHRLLAIILLGLIFSLSPSAFADQTAESIVHKMVKRDKELVQHRALYTYTVGETRQKLDVAGRELSSSYEETKIRGDKSPDYGTRKNQNIEADLKQAAKEEPFNILNIIDHFNYSLAGKETLNRVSCYKIFFSPKGKQPFHNREEKVANEIKGVLWVADTDFSLVKNTGTLTKPVSVAWFFATLQEMEFLFESSPLPNGELGPSRIEYRFKVQIPFGQIHERHTRVMKDYGEGTLQQKALSHP